MNPCFCSKRETKAVSVCVTFLEHLPHRFIDMLFYAVVLNLCVFLPLSKCKVVKTEAELRCFCVPLTQPTDGHVIIKNVKK